MSFLDRKSLPICFDYRPTNTEGASPWVLSVPDRHGALHWPIAAFFAYLTHWHKTLTGQNAAVALAIE